ncbi:MAG: glucosyl-dolichyl phosphate glucuronosyltransferase [Natronomonas sp.]
MKVSVVVCTYAMERFEPFREAVESVLAQSYEPIEVVLVVDGNEPVFDRVRGEFGDRDNVVIHCNDENRGISYSRTRGGELASGEIVAFIDDDGVAEADWVERLVDAYEEYDALAVAGPVEPDWVGGKPEYFPAEFYWLVGCTERGFAEDGDEIRNGYGSNISYRRDVFLDVGGYDVNTGRKGDAHIQAHEAPVGIRLMEQYGEGMRYTEDAVVHHTLFEYRGEFRWLLFRSFWQGYSKRVMDLLYPETYGDEGAFLRNLAFRYGPERVWNAITGPSLAQAKQLGAIVVFTAAVGLGYLYGLTKPKRRLLRGSDEPVTSEADTGADFEASSESSRTESEE